MVKIGKSTLNKSLFISPCILDFWNNQWRIYVIYSQQNTHYDLGVFINKTYYFHSKLLEIL